MTTKTLTPTDNILGYTLKEKIGAGSYGEVWAAEAPGGISKAVKFIFGCHDENRAQNELKSLNKIKEVRHPFLLSLERIEVVDGRLVIVTELADMSLNEKFLSYRKEGLPGIPRKELLGYIRDTADALDYISATHSLQHLDIKPENLLLVGGHIKVADFGLVKEVQEATQSLMSGLTPAYAPPELFDGRPNRYSDQYSLAIVFAEMVGGERPFDGTTAAKLAVQHMQSKPNLQRLSPRDQGIVLKALAKNPELRFGTCREFVEELLARQARTKAKKRRTNPNARAEEDAATVQIRSGGSSGTLMLGTEHLAGSRRPVKIEFAGKLDCEPEKAGVQPTLFIGVGATGTRIVRNLQARIRKQIGSDLPAIGMLCMDSDRRSLIESADSGDHGAINYNEILELPLRRPEDYRNDAKTHLSWLSRRWIYNIPRSLQTEGLRPLGRLAFVDNSDALFTRLDDIISQITTTNAIANSAETTGLNPIKVAPQVYIVSSIAGGIGSGCIVDLAYAIRTALAEMGLPDNSVTGILTHSTAAYDRDAQLAVANTYACLSELQHFTSYGYPGDDSCGLPDYDPEDGAFKDVYYVNLGSALDEDAYELATHGVAEYLFHNALTRCQAFHDSVRRVDECENNTVRTMGIASTDFDFRGETSLFGVDLSLAVVDEWLEAEGFDAEKFVDLIIDRMELSTASVMQLITDTVVSKRGPDFESKLITPFVEAASNTASPATDWKQAIGVLDKAIGRHAEQVEPPAKSLRGVLVTTSKETSHERAETLIHAIFNLVNVPDVRIGGAHIALDTTARRLRTSLDEIREKLKIVTDQQAQLADRLTLQQSKPKEAESFRDNLIRFARLRIQDTIVGAARELVSNVGAQLSATLPQMVNIKRDIESIRSSLQSRRENAAYMDAHVSLEGETLQEGFRSIMEAEFRENLLSLVPRVNEELERNFFTETSGLLGVLQDSDPIVRRQLLPEIVASAQAGVSQLMKNVDIDDLIRRSGISRDDLTSWIDEKLSHALPNALKLCGGNARLLLGIPSSSKGAELVEFIKTKFEYRPTTIAATSGDILFCYEGSNITLPNVAHSLLEERPECAHYVERLHTRLDVEWTKLTDIALG